MAKDDNNLEIQVSKDDGEKSVTISAPPDDTPSENTEITTTKDGKLHITVDGVEHKFDNSAKEHVAVVGDRDGDVHLSMDTPTYLTVISALTGAAVLLFILIVLPIWIIAHYRSKSQPKVAPRPAVPAATASDLSHLATIAERLERRLDAMEALMDAENPSWRK